MEVSRSQQPPSLGCLLIIEDNDQWGGLVERVMHPRYGFGAPKHVRTLSEGLAVLLAQDVTLVMLDLNLPDSSGLTTLVRVRSTAPDIPILVMSGDAEQEQALEALRQGAQEYLVKGRLSPDEIRHSARHAIERMGAQFDLRNSQALLTSTLNALPSCIALLDGEGLVISTNARWDAYENPHNPLIFGCRRGTDYLRACDLISDNPGDASRIASSVLQLMAGLSQHQSLDYKVPTLEGHAFFEFIGNRFMGRQGPMVVVSHTDISERKTLEGQLLASQELFLLISEHMEDLLAIIDAKGHRLYSSPSYSRALGYDPDEMTTLGSLDLLHPDDYERVEASLGRLFVEESVSRLEYRLQHRDGEYRFFESVARRIHSAPGTTAQALIVARDITERVKAQAEKDRLEVHLRQTQKLEAIGQLAAGIAHEINTPIQYIGDNNVFLQDSFNEIFRFMNELQPCLEQPDAAKLDALRQSFHSLDFEYLQDEIPKAIQQSLEGVSRVSRIVSAMKEFSHPGGEARERVDLNRAIESTLTVSRNEWKYVAELQTDLDPSLPLLPCFPGELNQVVLNLVVNAAHAIGDVTGGKDSAHKGLIRVSTCVEDRDVVIRISDNGAGIPEAIRARIFEPFFTTKAVGKGTGQGLAIAHNVVVDKHGGRIELESELGKGTTFILRLPLDSPDEAHP